MHDRASVIYAAGSVTYEWRALCNWPCEQDPLQTMVLPALLGTTPAARPAVARPASTTPSDTGVKKTPGSGLAGGKTKGGKGGVKAAAVDTKQVGRAKIAWHAIGHILIFVS